MKATWTPEDSLNASKEGWNLFECEGSFDFQREDEDSIFASDAEALAWVFAMATSGSDLHYRAMTFLLNQDVKPPKPWAD